jgi:hypothetical protein
MTSLLKRRSNVVNTLTYSYIQTLVLPLNEQSERRGRDRMVVGFTTTYAITAYHHQNCEFESRSSRGVLDTTICDKVCQ